MHKKSLRLLPKAFYFKLCAFNLAASQAVSANIKTGVSAVNNSSYLLYVGLPSMVGSSVGMGYSLTESYALSANFTLCHFITSKSVETLCI